MVKPPSQTWMTRKYKLDLFMLWKRKEANKDVVNQIEDKCEESTASNPTWTLKFLSQSYREEKMRFAAYETIS